METIPDMRRDYLAVSGYPLQRKCVFLVDSCYSKRIKCCFPQVVSMQTKKEGGCQVKQQTSMDKNGGGKLAK